MCEYIYFPLLWKYCYKKEKKKTIYIYIIYISYEAKSHLMITVICALKSDTMKNLAFLLETICFLCLSIYTCWRMCACMCVWGKTWLPSSALTLAFWMASRSLSNGRYYLYGAMTAEWSLSLLSIEYAWLLNVKPKSLSIKGVLEI